MGAGNAELVAWYEEATAYYNAVLSGQETQPDPAAWQSFVDQMQWAAGQLGYGAPQAWDPMAAGQGSLPAAETAADPFGGQPGAMDNLVYTQETTQIGFIGEERPMDIWSTDITLDVASTSVDVTVEETQDTRFQPPETVLKVVMTDQATGKTSVYFLHDPEEIESLKINTPGAKHVNDLSGRAEVGEFVEGATGQGGGIPEGAEIDGDTATYDGVAGQTLDFEPPFGGIRNHVVYSNANISVKNSDEVLVERLSDGGYRVTVTDLDGEKTVFTVPEGFYLNINAHAPNVTFKDGGRGTIGGLAAPGGGAPKRTSGSNSGSDGVPAGWENIGLNGTTAEDTEAVDSADWPPQLIDLLDAMGVAPEDYGSLNIPDSLLSEIKSGVKPPSQALLDALKNSDETLKQAWDRAKSNPEDAHAWQQVKQRLATLLGALYGSGVDAEGTFPEGMEADEALTARTLFLDGFAYEIGEGFRLKPVEGEEIPVAPEDQDSYDNAERLADLLDKSNDEKMTAEEIVTWAEEKGVDLSNLAFPPSPEIWELLYERDGDLSEKLQNWKNNPSWETTAALRDYMVEVFKRLYPELNVSGDDRTGGGDNNRKYANDITVNGQTFHIFPDDWISHGPQEIYTELWSILSEKWDNLED
ncbi:hypothetical protein FBR05_03300 [Deltaproteobacteria bacterium PRO3]|nr:hypothetical protein [Deltaproteobacteria bacterium PRO3]